MPASPPEVEPLVATYALDATQVQVGNNNAAGLYLAPAGTAPPADTKTPWASPWAILGYIADDGVTVSTNTDTNEIIPWQSAVPLLTVPVKKTVELQFKLWQLNDKTIALYFDADPPTPAADGSFGMDVLSSASLHLYAVGIDAADGSTATNHALRIVFQRASLTDSGDMTIKRGEAIPLDVKLGALDYSGKLARVLLGTAA